MTKSAGRILFSILVLAVALTLSSDFSFAEDEHASEEHETENAATEQEHASHESEAVHEPEEEPKHEHVQEAGEGPHVHNSVTAEAAKWVGVGTLIGSIYAFVIKARSPTGLAYKGVVLTLAVGAGIIHLLLTPDHLADVNVPHAVFFATAGSAQVVYGLLFMARPTRAIAMVGIAGNIGNVILYFVTRIENLPEPFAAPEGVDAVGILTKIVEMSLVAVLIYVAVRLRKTKPAEIKGR